MKYISIFLLLQILLYSCKQHQYADNIYNETYTIGEVPNLKSFQTYDEYDQRMDSIFVNNSLPGGRDFKHNRSKIFMQTFKNGKLSSQDSALYKGMPTPCYYTFNKDTITISVGIGFFGGMGFQVKIFRDHFYSNYFLYTDDVKPYKYNLNDKEFTSELYLKNQFQTLIFGAKPTFKPGQQLTGCLIYTSPTYYETAAGALDSFYVKGKLYFTCETQ